MVNKKERLINEICAQRGLESYRNTIANLLEEIYTEGAIVSCKYNESASNIDPSEIRPCHIRISMIRVKHTLNIIWALLHEFGHYLDWPRNHKDSKIDRENRAWQIAEKYLNKYPDLQEKILWFHEYKDWCLSTYKKANQN